MSKPYDIEIDVDDMSGFYEWNKPNFLIDEKDKRYKKFQKFKEEHGFSPDECWSFYISICIFILPRLKHFREKIKEIKVHPTTFDNVNEWLKVLDKMIYAFQWILDEDKIPYDNKKKSDKIYKGIEEGLKLFSEYFQCLWW